MLEIAGNLVRTLVLIVMVAALLDMLIPQNHFRQYLRMVIGMLVLLMVVNALANLTGRSLKFVLPSFGTGEREYAHIMEEGRKLWQKSQGAALEQYRANLSHYIEGELRAWGGWELKKLEVSLEEDPEKPGFGRINGATVLVSAEKNSKEDPEGFSPIQIPPVRIGEGASNKAVGEENGPQEMEENSPELRRKVAGWLHLPLEAVQVRFVK